MLLRKALRPSGQLDRPSNRRFGSVLVSRTDAYFIPARKATHIEVVDSCFFLLFASCGNLPLCEKSPSREPALPAASDTANLPQNGRIRAGQAMAAAMAERNG